MNVTIADIIYEHVKTSMGHGVGEMMGNASFLPTLQNN
jgi:hypothetical protein